MTDTPNPENWKPIPGHPGYEVSDLGQVRSLDRTLRTAGGYNKFYAGRVLKQQTQRKGYRTLLLGSGTTPQLVHRLVLAAFVGPCPEKHEVRHLDGDPSNNRLTNLAYGTHSENMLDQVRHGTHWQVVKTHCPRGHKYTPDNIQKDAYQPVGRRCKQCNRDKVRRYYEKKRAT